MANKYHCMALANDGTVLFEREMESKWSINRVSSWARGKVEKHADLKRVIVKNVALAGRITEWDKI